MNELPLIVSLLKTVCFAGDKSLCLTIFEYDIDLLNRANNAHRIAHCGLYFEDVDFTGLETTEYLVEHFPGGFYPL